MRQLVLLQRDAKAGLLKEPGKAAFLEKVENYKSFDRIFLEHGVEEQDIKLCCYHYKTL